MLKMNGQSHKMKGHVEEKKSSWRATNVENVWSKATNWKAMLRKKKLKGHQTSVRLASFVVTVEFILQLSKF